MKSSQIVSLSHIRHLIKTGCAGASLLMLLFSFSASAGAAVLISTNYYHWSSGESFALQFTNVIAANAGSDTVVLLLSNGRVTNMANNPPLAAPSTLTNVAAISTDDTYYCMALTSNGTVSVWGYQYDLTNVPKGLSNVTAIAAGWDNCLALLSNGTVVSWGDITNVPAGLSNVVSVSAGRDDNLALQANGKVVEWGPSANAVPSGLSDVIAVSAGNGAEIALLTNGTILEWNGTSTNVLPDITNAVAISGGGSDGVLALQADGLVVTAGQSFSFDQPGSNAFYISVSIFTDIDTVVTGNGVPVFTVQPGNQTVGAGGAIYLHARTAATQPVALQWQQNGTNLPGATNGDLFLTNVTVGNAGTYQALAVNSVGQAASSVATVGVIPPARIAILLAPPIAQPDGSLVITASTANGAAFSLASTSFFILQASSDLINWNALTNGLSLTNGAIDFTDFAAATNSARFYRLLRQ
ncbi:MAG: hypothetical protein ABSH38_17615 [Verrucomicrobiota bacterium]|jgi:hypothetical protein